MGSTLALADKLDDGRSRLAAALVAAFGFVVYLRTLLPSQAFGDWGEMQTVPHTLSIAHPTGYPTYLLLAWLAELPPIGSVAFRANLLSAIFVALTLATFVLICVRLAIRPTLALAAGATLGTVGTVWAAATVAEVNPLHLLFAALIVHRALVWEARKAPRDLFLGALLVGLSLGNHLLTIFIAPFVALFVLWAGRREWRARPALMALPFVGLALGLSVYLYIPIAVRFDPPLVYNDPLTWNGFVFLVSGEQFRGQFDFLSPNGASEFARSLPDLWGVLVDRGATVVPILGLVGLVVLAVRRPAFALMAAAMLITGFYLWATYLRLEHYLLVPWLLIGIGLAAALEGAARGVERLARPQPGREASATGARGRLGGRAVLAASLALAVVVGVTNWGASDRSADRSAADYADDVFRNLPPDAAIFTSWDAASPLWYGRYIEGRRPDILIVDDTNIVYEGWVTREARIATLICQRPVFMVRANPGELAVTTRDYALTPFLTVPGALDGPTAEVTRTVYRVTPLDPTTCGG